MTTVTTTKLLLLTTLLAFGCAHSTTGTGASGSAGDGGMGGWTLVTGGDGGTGGQGSTTTSSEGGTAGAAGAGGMGTTSSTGPSLQDLKDLCTGSGGTPYQDQCCSDAGEMPDSCAAKPNCGAVLTCSGGNSIDPNLWLCSCPGAACFDHDVGCAGS